MKRDELRSIDAPVIDAGVKEAFDDRLSLLLEERRLIIKDLEKRYDVPRKSTAPPQLNDEQQRQVQEFLKDCQDLYVRGYLKDGACIKPDAWFSPLLPGQHQQIVAYLHSIPVDAENSKVLNWYEDEHEFRLERAFSPVTSR